MIKVTAIEDEGRIVFFRVQSVWFQNKEQYIASFRLDVPPSDMIGGEFVKDEHGRTKFFQTEPSAADAAKQLYEEKKADLTK